MMKKVLFVLLAFSLVLTSCGPDPVKFNDSLIYYVDKAHNQTNALQNNFLSASSPADFSKITADVPAVVDSLNAYIKQLEVVKAPKDGEEFKSEVVSYMNSLVVAIDSYKTITNITDNSTQDQINEITKTITEKENVAEKLFEEVQSKQIAFAKENKMQLR